jgi:hypothetical protein
VGNPERILQFKITLKNTKPPVWRRIQVPGDYTFWDLHVAIQDSMGWLDCHLHEFAIFNPRKHREERIGIPDMESFAPEETRAGWEVPVARLFTRSHPSADYIYDFGDGWEHKVILEKSLPREEGTHYPQCIGGRRKCPPEDCGGPWGYEDFLKAMSDPTHESHKEMVDWIGGHFDPDDFEPKKVAFDDPKRRLTNAFL